MASFPEKKPDISTRNFPVIGGRPFSKAHAFVRHSKERARSLYGADTLAYKTLDKLSVLEEGDAVIGSSPFVVVHAQYIVEHHGYDRVAGFADISDSANLPPSFFDTSFLLQSEHEPLEPLQEVTHTLVRDLKSRSKHGNVIYPIFIDLHSLRLEEGENPYGLVFRLREDASFQEHARTFHPRYNGEKISGVDKNGNPLFDEEGRYSLIIDKKEGLSRFLIEQNNSFGLSSYFPDVSDHRGRIVAVREEPYGKTVEPVGFNSDEDSKEYLRRFWTGS